MTPENLSIIIPLGPDEDQLAPLLDDLRRLGSRAEIIVVTCDEGAARCKADDLNIQWLQSAQGRAIQQNTGARAAGGDFLWFVHADSRPTAQGLAALMAALMAAPDALHYFHLKFAADGPPLMRLNEWGAWARSQILKVPFGDQGFCLKKDHFNQIGGFPEQVPYGEDHLLVWRARQAGIKLRCTGAPLMTSARAYGAHGWAALTAVYQLRWIKQALPEFYRLIRRQQGNRAVLVPEKKIKGGRHNE